MPNNELNMKHLAEPVVRDLNTKQCAVWRRHIMYSPLFDIVWVNFNFIIQIHQLDCFFLFFEYYILTQHNSARWTQRISWKHKNNCVRVIDLLSLLPTINRLKILISRDLSSSYRLHNCSRCESYWSEIEINQICFDEVFQSLIYTSHTAKSTYAVWIVNDTLIFLFFQFQPLRF